MRFGEKCEKRTKNKITEESIMMLELLDVANEMLNVSEGLFKNTL